MKILNFDFDIGYNMRPIFKYRKADIKEIDWILDLGFIWIIKWGIDE